MVIGTRPEAIKLAPLILELRSKTRCTVRVVYTAQHMDLVLPILEFFEIGVDVTLSLPQGLGITEVYGKLIQQLGDTIGALKPSAVVVQGDTASACAAAMAGFLSRVPVLHVEAGLRTHDLYAPWPEELNRRVISLVASMHFAHSKSAMENLLAEGTQPDRIRITGNTGIDAALIAERRVREDSRFWKAFVGAAEGFDAGRPFVLMTVHRRENHGQPLSDICDAVTTLAAEDGCQVVLPVHPNPEVQAKVTSWLKGRKGIVLCTPLNYPIFMAAMVRSWFILTDSGGIQEEAPCLGKPVIVLRGVTERQEVAQLGNAVVVGPSSSAIIAAARKLIRESAAFASMSIRRFPFGRGDAAGKIVAAMVPKAGA